MVRVGFEPTPPKRLRPERSALDRSATSPLLRRGRPPAPPAMPGESPKYRKRVDSRSGFAQVVGDTKYNLVLTGLQRNPVDSGEKTWIPIAHNVDKTYVRHQQRSEARGREKSLQQILCPQEWCPILYTARFTRPWAARKFRHWELNPGLLGEGQVF